MPNRRTYRRWHDTQQQHCRRTRWRGWHLGILTVVNSTLSSNVARPSPPTHYLHVLTAIGGPTLTHAPMENSPAIDAGDNAVCAASPVNGVDQRNAARPEGDHCDLGAYEVGGTPTAIVINEMAASTIATWSLSLLMMGMAGAVIGLIWRKRRTA